jgi:hypothetical protein
MIKESYDFDVHYFFVNELLNQVPLLFDPNTYLRKLTHLTSKEMKGLWKEFMQAFSQIIN